MTKRLLFSVAIDDCDVQTFASGGPGGQHQNKTASGVRIVHRASGAVGEARDERSQHTNKRLAWRRMVASRVFKAWHRRVTSELMTGKTLEQRVEEEMTPEKIRVEARTAHGWERIE